MLPERYNMGDQEKSVPKETRPAQVTFGNLDAIAKRIPELQSRGPVSIDKIYSNHSQNHELVADLNRYVDRYRQAFVMSYAMVVNKGLEQPKQIRTIKDAEAIVKNFIEGNGGSYEAFQTHSHEFAQGMLVSALSLYAHPDTVFARSPSYVRVLPPGKEDLEQVASYLDNYHGINRAQLGTEFRSLGEHETIPVEQAKQKMEPFPDHLPVTIRSYNDSNKEGYSISASPSSNVRRSG
jgi:hypothetical protein